MMQKAPALFVGHGSPMNAIERTPASQGWRDVARRFPKPRAIVCVSAHWVTDGLRVAATARPRTIHDFGGFPPALSAVQYPTPGAPELARDIVQRLAGFNAEADEHWGLDHGAWSVLVHMYPEADIPVLQVSLDARRNPQQHYEIGRALAPLRADNVLILASGNVVHNLRVFFRTPGAPTPWAARFDAFVAERIAARDHAALINYGAHPDAAEAAPDWDHFYPLLYALAAQGEEEPAEAFNRDMSPGVSMTAYAIGLPA